MKRKQAEETCKSCSRILSLISLQLLIYHYFKSLISFSALSKGKHVFEIYWPSRLRGTSATVGVGSDDAPLFVKPKDSLVGCNSFSWGLDIARKRLLHKGEMLGTMPRGGVVPDKYVLKANYNIILWPSNYFNKCKREKKIKKAKTIVQLITGIKYQKLFISLLV
jgi:hypothetical protein